MQEPPEKDLQFMLGNSTCVDDPKDLDSQNVTTLEEFILSLRFALLFNILIFYVYRNFFHIFSEDIAQELFKLM